MGGLREKRLKLAEKIIVEINEETKQKLRNETLKKIDTLKEYRAKILQNLGTMHDSAKIVTIESAQLQHEKNEKSKKIHQMALKSHQKLKANNLRKKAEAKKCQI